MAKVISLQELKDRKLVSYRGTVYFSYRFYNIMFRFYLHINPHKNWFNPLFVCIPLSLWRKGMFDVKKALKTYLKHTRQFQTSDSLLVILQPSTMKKNGLQIYPEQNRLKYMRFLIALLLGGMYFLYSVLQILAPAPLQLIFAEQPKKLFFLSHCV